MNLTGKGGFGDHPEHRNDDGRPKRKTLTEKILAILEEKQIKLEELIANLIMEKNVKTTLHTYDHVDGRPVQKQILAGDEEQPVRLIIETEEKEK